MTKQELSVIHARYFNSPKEVSVFDPPKSFQRCMKNKKPSQLPGVTVWNSLEKGTFVGKARELTGRTQVV